MTINIFGRNLTFLLFSLSFVFPATLVGIKIILLFLICALILLKVKEVIFNKELFLITLFFVVLGLFYSIYGLINDNSGALETATVMVIYPLLFLFLTTFFSSMADFFKMANVLILTGFLVALSQIMFLLSSYALIPSIIENYFQELYPSKAILDIRDNSFFFTLPNVSSLLFLIPFLSSYLLLITKNEFFYRLLLLILICLILLTGRRAFFISFSFSLFFLIYVSYFINKDLGLVVIKKLIIMMSFFAILMIVVIIYYNINLEIYISYFISIFDISLNESNLERVYQFNSLLMDISKAPLFGSGAGAASEYCRSVTQPWSYELTYIAFIFHYGILGFLIYLSGIIYIFISLIRICQDKLIDSSIKIFIISFLSGMVSFLVANATNPYLEKFDYMWVIFVPVIIIHTYKNKTRKKIENI